MKDSIIRLNDYLCYLVVLLCIIVGFASYSFLGALGGFVVGAVMAGFWLVLSGIYDELKKANASRGI